MYDTCQFTCVCQTVSVCACVCASIDSMMWRHVVREKLSRLPERKLQLITVIPGLHDQIKKYHPGLPCKKQKKEVVFLYMNNSNISGFINFGWSKRSERGIQTEKRIGIEWKLFCSHPAEGNSATVSSRCVCACSSSLTFVRL